ncbi:MAG: cyclopropane-fatty-acyl-phospholipid synthase family protein [Thermoleophilia bacterium]|nr:cyclopropane-fatty-acyl-phospholipid synthase family protein [Thermoleophilia bacterium]
MNIAADVARRLSFRALFALEGGEVVLRYPDGRGRRFGDGKGPSVLVELRRPDAFWRKLGTRTRVGFGESYVNGDWDCDDLVGLFSLVGRNLETTGEHPTLKRLYRLQELRPDRRPRQTEAAAKDNILAHYDLGNELFALMLDPTLAYSCAYWERPGMTLEEAQRAKVRHICEKLDLEPDDHVLEIGCGWGGFAIQAATEFGCRVTGLTLSPSQAGLARERVEAAGLSDRVEIREQDYRLTQGRFTKIASIEMFEAIGLAEYDNYFSVIDRLLTRGGLACIQTIGVPDWRFERYRRRPDWIQQTIFPGSLLPSLESIAKAVAGTQLQINGVEEIGFGYARTLREWRENVERNIDQIRSLGYDDRFLRLWHYYLTYCEAGFAIRSLRDMQIVLSHSANDALPEFPRVRPGY